MPSEAEPLPCPYCGDPLRFDADVGATGVWFHRATEEDTAEAGEPSCLMSAYMVRNRPHSIARWNRRALSAASAVRSEPVKPAERVGQLVSEALALAPAAGLFLEITIKEATDARR
jgi:hypothetical protein